MPDIVIEEIAYLTEETYRLRMSDGKVLFLRRQSPREYVSHITLLTLYHDVIRATFSQSVLAVHTGHPYGRDTECSLLKFDEADFILLVMRATK